MQFPAPWTLSGRGLVLFHRVRGAWRQRHFAHWRGPVAMTMWVDYQDSPVGPYREWLMVPGRMDNTRGRHFSISHIYVDSGKSLIGGQENWGIPKQMGEFEFRAGKERVDASLAVGDTRLELGGRIAGPAIPVNNGWWPVALYQQRGGQEFWTAPRMRGRCRWLRVDRAAQSGDGFPDLTGEPLLAAFYAERFEMTFPIAERVGERLV